TDDFSLTGHPLPQSIAVVSRGMTRGAIDISVQGLAAGTLKASATTTADLPGSTRVSLLLVPTCMPRTACDAGMECGSIADGCGGSVPCTGNCGSGRFCHFVGSFGTCECNGGLTDCGGSCVDLQTNSTNCGACANACPLAQQCHGGLCPCVDAGSNIDGHCCP